MLLLWKRKSLEYVLKLFKCANIEDITSGIGGTRDRTPVHVFFKD